LHQPRVSLVQRVTRDSAMIPSLVPQEFLRDLVAPPSEETVNPVLPDPPGLSRQLRMSDFVNDKREVFLLEVMIQRNRD
jgi:hypothetical protein